MAEDPLRGGGRGKDLGAFQKGQIIGLYLGDKTTKEIAETIKISTRTVQRVIKRWRDGGNPVSARKKCGRKKVLNDRDRRTLARLVRSNRKKTTAELTAMFKSGSKNISIRTMRRELKGQGFKCYLSLEKTRNTEANGGKEASATFQQSRDSDDAQDAGEGQEVNSTVEQM